MTIITDTSKMITRREEKRREERARYMARQAMRRAAERAEAEESMLRAGARRRQAFTARRGYFDR